MSLLKKDSQETIAEKSKGEEISTIYQHGNNEVIVYKDGSVLVKYLLHAPRRFGSLSEYYAVSID